MIEQDYQEIKELIGKGMSLRQASKTNARKIQFIRMRKKRGEANPLPKPQPFPSPKPLPNPNEVATVIREATIAANIVPTHIELPAVVSVPAPRISPWIDLRNASPVDTRELLEMAKRAIFQQLSMAPLMPAWVKLVFELCEKELPEWSSRNTKVAKDEYQSILEAMFKKTTGFQLTERKDNVDDVKPDNAGKVRSPG